MNGKKAKKLRRMMESLTPSEAFKAFSPHAAPFDGGTTYARPAFGDHARLDSSRWVVLSDERFIGVAVAETPAEAVRLALRDGWDGYEETEVAPLGEPDARLIELPAPLEECEEQLGLGNCYAGEEIGVWKVGPRFWWDCDRIDSDDLAMEFELLPPAGRFFMREDGER